MAPSVFSFVSPFHNRSFFRPANLALIDIAFVFHPSEKGPAFPFGKPVLFADLILLSPETSFPHPMNSHTEIEYCPPGFPLMHLNHNDVRDCGGIFILLDGR
jgi:hypothetical protein